MKTGFNDLDNLINLDNGNLIIVGARPSMGKSSFVLNVATNVAKKDNGVLIFNLELSKEEIKNRIIASASMVDLYIEDTPNLTIDAIEERCIKEKQQNNICLVIIDYVQLISQYKVSVEEISSRLKELSKKLNIPIICVSQLSRDIEKRINNRPILTDFALAKCLVDNADIVLLLYRDDYYNPESELKGITEVFVAKNKENKIGIAELVYLNKYMKFANKSISNNV